MPLSRVVGLLVALCVLLATACSSTAPTLGAPDELPLVDDESVEPTPEATADVEPTPTPATDVSEDAADRLHVGMVGEPNLNPAEASLVRPADMFVADLLYDGLTAWNEQTQMWSLDQSVEITGNADSSVWTFTMGEDHTFADGTSFDAADVERSLEAALADRTSVPAQRLDMIVGMDTDDVDLPGIRAIALNVLEIELTRPFGGLPAALSSPIFGIVPQGDLVGTNGSGSMRLLTKANGTLLFEPVATRTSSDLRIELHIFDNEQDLQDAFDSGDIHVAYGATEGDTVAQRNVQVHYGVNVAHWKLLDENVREAVAAAIDRDALVQVLGGGVAMRSLTEPCVEPCDADIDRVQTALDRALRGGQTPTLFVDYIADESGTEADLAGALAGQLVAAGIPAEAREHTLADFVELVANGEHELYRAGWTGLYPSLDSKLAPFLTDGVDNASGYSLEDFDEFMTAARRLFDGSDMYKAAERALLNDVAVLPLVALTHDIQIAESVQGVQLRLDGSFDVKPVAVG